MKRWVVVLWAVLLSVGILAAPTLGSGSVTAGSFSEDPSRVAGCASKVKSAAAPFVSVGGRISFTELHVLRMLAKQSRTFTAVSRDWETFVWADKEYLSEVRSRNPERRKRYVNAEAFLRVSSYVATLSHHGLISARPVFSDYEMLTIEQEGRQALRRERNFYLALEKEIGAEWLQNVADTRDRTRFPGFSPLHAEVLGVLFRLEHARASDEWVTQAEFSAGLVEKGLVQPGQDIGFMLFTLYMDGLIAWRDDAEVPGVMYTAKAQGFLRNLFAYHHALDDQ